MRLDRQYCFPEGNIWFPQGSYLRPEIKDSSGFTKEIFGSPKGVICLERNYWFPEENIWFPEGI